MVLKLIASLMFNLWIHMEVVGFSGGTWVFYKDRLVWWKFFSTQFIICHIRKSLGVY